MNWTGLGDRIRERRTALSKSPRELAAILNMGKSEYDDIERYDDEAPLVHDLSTLRALAKALEWTIWELLQWCPPEVPNTIGRSALIRETRQTLGMSLEELADHTVWYPEVVARAEKDDSEIESWPLSYVCDLAAGLRIPPERLIDTSGNARRAES